MHRVGRCGLVLNASLDYSYVTKGPSCPRALVHLTGFNVWRAFPVTLYTRTLHVNAYVAVGSRANTYVRHVIKQPLCHLDPSFLKDELHHSQMTGADVMFLLSLFSSTLQGVSRRFDAHTHTHRDVDVSRTSNAHLHLKGKWKTGTFVNNPCHEFKWWNWTLEFMRASFSFTVEGHFCKTSNK